MLRGYFINLADAHERRAHMESELRRLGLDDIYSRVEAVDGRTLTVPSHVRIGPGKWGIWMTWRRLLEQSAGSDSHVHILEDDIVFSDRFSPFMRDLDGLLQGRKWDLLYTYMMTTFSPINVRKMVRILQDTRRDGKIALINARDFFRASNASVLINKDSLAKVRSYLGDDVDGRWPLDHQFGSLLRSGKLTALATIPYLAKLGDIHLDSQIDPLEGTDKPERYQHAWMLVNEMFFDGVDLPALKDRMAMLSRKFAPEGFEGFDDYMEIYKNMVAIVVGSKIYSE